MALVPAHHRRPPLTVRWARLLPLGSCAALVATCLAAAALGGGGCAGSDKPTSRPGDAALRDPMGYKPTFEDPDISGGGIGHFDSKAFNRDLKSVFDP